MRGGNPLLLYMIFGITGLKYKAPLSATVKYLEVLLFWSFKKSIVQQDFESELIRTTLMSLYYTWS